MTLTKTQAADVLRAIRQHGSVDAAYVACVLGGQAIGSWSAQQALMVLAKKPQLLTKVSVIASV